MITSQSKPQLKQQSKIDSKSLLSSAYPSNKKIQQKSIFHNLIRAAKQIKNNVDLRPFKRTDVIQVRHLQMQWFPLNYGDYFYNRLLSNYYNCLIAETQIIIEWCALKQILKEKFLRQSSECEKQMKNKEKRNIALIEPSKYFQYQGIKFEYLQQDNDKFLFGKQLKQKLECGQEIIVNCENIEQEKKESTQIKQLKKQTVMKIKIIAGILVFDITSSGGLLRGSWWQQSVLGINNSLYINTIGVIGQLRKNGVARLLLNWLRQKAEKQKQYRYIYLHVIQYNTAAINLYHKMGFVDLQLIQDFYQIDGKEYRARLLGLFVNGGQKKPTWSEWISSFWT